MTCRQCEGPDGKFIYTFINKRATRPEASHGCLQRNETLATKLSRQDYSRLYSKDCCLSRTRSYWIGLDKSNECNRTRPYRWFGTTTCVNSGSLSITGYQQRGCQSVALPPVTTFGKGKGFAVNLRNCTEKLGYICKKPNPKAIISLSPEDRTTTKSKIKPTKTTASQQFESTTVVLGAIAGIVALILLVFILSVFLFYFCYKKRKATRKERLKKVKASPFSSQKNENDERSATNTTKINSSR